LARINIAVDGHSSCGKSTLAKSLAFQLGYVYIDTGAMYRAVTYWALENGFINEGVVDSKQIEASLNDVQVSFQYNTEQQRSDTLLNGENVEGFIRSMRVSSHVSAVSTIKAVRKKLVALQQDLGVNGGVVMDGRDIGTVVFPQAELKLFMTASAAVRAQRRFEELQSKGDMVTYEEVFKNLTDRDYTDSNRTESPLKQAEDAIVIDNSEMSRETQMQLALNYANERIGVTS